MSAKTDQMDGMIPKSYKEIGAHIEYTVRHEQHHNLVDLPLWNHQGWSLQELVFSQRAVFFHDHNITWECHCAIWHEKDKLNALAAPAEQCLGHFSKNTKGSHYAAWPDLEEYTRLVKNYSERKLTYLGDVFPAFMGKLTTLSQSFKGGFIFRLPELFLDVPLLWQPQSLVSDWQFSRYGSQATALPSWSWVGWHGCNARIDLESWSSCFDYVRECPRSISRTDAWKKISLRTKSIVQWYIKTKTGKKSITNNIVDDYYKYRQDSSIPLPPGWSREQEVFPHICDPNTTFEYNPEQPKHYIATSLPRVPLLGGCMPPLL